MRDVSCAKAVVGVREKKERRMAKRDFSFILASKAKRSHVYLTPYLLLSISRRGGDRG